MFNDRSPQSTTQQPGDGDVDEQVGRGQASVRSASPHAGDFAAGSSGQSVCTLFAGFFGREISAHCHISLALVQRTHRMPQATIHHLSRVARSGVLISIPPTDRITLPGHHTIRV